MVEIESWKSQLLILTIKGIALGAIVMNGWNWELKKATINFNY